MLSLIFKNWHHFFISRNIVLYQSNNCHCMKSVRIRSYSGPHFPAFGLVCLRIQVKCGKMQTRITPNTDTFHAVKMKIKVMSQWKLFEILLASAVTYMTAILSNIFNTENMLRHWSRPFLKALAEFYKD